MAGLLMGARERWPLAPATGTEAAMEILLIIRFCCNCTYGNPDPSHGRWCIFPPLGAGGWNGLKCDCQGLGDSKGGWAQVARLELCVPLFWPASSLRLKSGGHLGQGALEMEGLG